MEERSVLSWAKEYLDKGYSVIPLEEKGKKPAILWRKYQKERATLSEAKGWFTNSSRNIGVVTGAISGLYVVDIDVRHGASLSSISLRDDGWDVTTGSGGYHCYYLWGSGVVEGNTSSLLAKGVDTRGEGGYVVAPPSYTKDAYRYKGQSIPELKSLPILPERIRAILLSANKWTDKKDTIGERVNEKNNNIAGSFVPVQFLSAREGERNHTAARVAGSIARGCGNYGRGLQILRLWNHAECVPPLGEPEIKTVWESIWRKHTSGGTTFTKPNRATDTSQQWPV